MTSADPTATPAATAGELPSNSLRLAGSGAAPNSADASAAVPGTPPSFRDRLLAVALAAHDHVLGRPDSPARRARAAAALGLPAELRVLAWALAHDSAAEVRGWLGRWRRIALGCTAVALGVAVVLGWLAAQTALGLDRSRPTNVYWLLGGVLLPQTLLLLVWVGLFLFGGSLASAFSLGGALWAAILRLTAGGAGGTHGGRSERAAAAAAAGAAVAGTFAGGSLARWTLGLATNSIWTAFNFGTLAAAVALLVVQQHEFCWESTLLSTQGYHRLTAAIGWLPSLLGFPVPDAAQIAAARLDPSNPDAFRAQEESARVAWSGLLVGSVVAYGLLPRALLAALSGALMTRAMRRWRLDLDSPLLAPIAAALAPTSVLGAATPDIAWPGSAAGVSADAARNLPRHPSIAMPVGATVGPALLVGLELSVPASGWPPAPLTGAGLVDLGRIEGREDRRAALEAVAASGVPSRGLIVVGSLTTTPDRGIGALLRELVEAAAAPATLVLTGGSALRGGADAAAVGGRAAEWRRVAVDAGVDAARVHEIDLDRLTAATSATLRALVSRSDLPPPSRRIETSFVRIAAAADAWAALDAGPSLGDQALLHREIAAFYGSGAAQGGGVSRLLGLSAPDAASLLQGGMAASGALAERTARGLAVAGERFVDLLPAGLRMQPKWLAAGALAGALGCAAAALVGPAAIAAPLALQALPIWSALGAAIGGVLSTRRGQEGSAVAGGSDPACDSADLRWSDAVRAAALHAVVLELQGGGEARISAGLERAFGDPGADSPPLRRGGGSAARWLDGVRHRLDVGLAPPRGGGGGGGEGVSA